MRLQGNRNRRQGLLSVLMAGLGALLLMSTTSYAQRYPKASVKETGVTSETYQSISFNASYNWNTSSNSNAVFYQGKYSRTYMTWVDNYGDVHVGSFDYKSNKISSKQIFDNDQNIPVESVSLLVNKSGKVIVFVGFAGNKNAFVAQTEEAENIKNWNVKELALNAVNTIQPVISNDKLTLFWQDNQGNIFTSDSGLKDKKLVTTGVTNFRLVSDEAVHMAITKNESLYYLKLQDSKIYKVDGTESFNLSSGAINDDKMDLVVQDTESKGLWAWDIALSKEGTPVIVYSNNTGEKKFNYSRVTRKSDNWYSKLMADSKGNYNYSKAESAPFQVGGIAIDKSSTDAIYLSVKRGDFFEIEKWTTTNQGKSWKVKEITSKSSKNNLLPLAVNGAGMEYPAHVVWLQNTNDSFGVNRLKNTNEWYLKRAYTALKIDVLSPTIDNPLDPTQINHIMHDVADWQMVTPRYNKGMLTATNWHYGALYVGLRALYEQYEDDRYKDELINIGQSYNWQLMDDIFHADRLTIVDNWAWLYSIEKDPYMIDKSRWALDIHLAQNYKKLTDVRFKKSPYKHHWWTWCDALFMGPPSFVEMWKVTGQEKYLNYMSEQWWKTSEYLYSTEDSLFFRDDRFFEKRSENDKKIFWSRGNGWVVSALARILTYLPEDYPTRPKFEKQYKEMAAKLLQLQDEDGMWRVSLFDPEYLDLGETSGSSFFTYALAWGVNNGMLDQKYTKDVERAWVALCNNVTAEGQLGYVQQVAGDPYPFKANESHVYACGAFLLAGKEMIELQEQKANKVPNK
ncbi:glycoside hydrolase family 105 protein [Flammeovirga sp. OC4]|uniref:glycoside hydrolase family 88/105 protein n=1 Tax=Flammeovirga sp. OC4 TaxID=1382345 RepID=UPI000693F4B6|nr:glycoside hydrolase family 88 protein [Flammeovirga sp. OC4]